MKKITIIIFIAFVTIISCKKDSNIVSPDPKLEVDILATPYNLVSPTGFPPIKIPAFNKMTVEGIALGRKLFYDPILSFDNTQSCGSCHSQNFAFTDNNSKYSRGIFGDLGDRNAMPIMNLAWEKKFFWDGGAASLEDQVIAPILNQIEMHETLPNVLNKLRNHADYPKLFKKAFGTDSITTMLLMKAVAQFERTIISANSKYDKYVRGELDLTADELAGKELFIDQQKGDCNHCHILGSTFTDFDFKNNGLDSIFKDLGRYRITLNDADKGKFKTPTLRNIELTAPYMHDGRFATLEQVVEHYNSEFIITPTTDVNIALLDKSRGRLTPTEKTQIIAFLKTLTDYDFISNPNFKKP